MTGIVTKIQIKKSRPKRNYGFIRGKDDKDYYFSLMGIKETFNVGDRVVFEGERNEKGFIATNVSLFH